MSDPRYQDGDVVWCKCGGLYWPGEVKGLASLPPEIRDGFLRMPLVVVKFFDEDGYEFVLNEKDIYPYTCEKKIQFIQKGLARHRGKAKEGATEGWFAKFPKDVVHCERLIGGNPNLLEEEPFAEKKEARADYSSIFSEQTEKAAKEKKKTKAPRKSGAATSDKTTKSSSPSSSVVGKTPKLKLLKKPGNLNSPKTPSGGSNGKTPTSSTPKSALGMKSKKKGATGATQVTPKITHPRFLQGSDHEVRILAQPSTPYHMEMQSTLTPKSLTPNYRCPLCEFVASRLNVIVLHTKSHSATRVSYAPEPGDLPWKPERAKQNQDTVLPPKKSVSLPPKKSVSLPPKKSLSLPPKKNILLPPKKRERPTAGRPEKNGVSNSKKLRLTKKQREEKVEKEKKKEEEKKKLLVDWSEDDDEEAEEFKKIQESINQSLRTESSSEEDEEGGLEDHHLSFLDSDDEMPLLHNNSRIQQPGSSRLDNNLRSSPTSDVGSVVSPQKDLLTGDRSVHLSSPIAVDPISTPAVPSRPAVLNSRFRPSTASGSPGDKPSAETKSLDEFLPVSRSLDESLPVSKSLNESTPVSKSLDESTPVSKSLDESTPVSKSLPEPEPVIDNNKNNKTSRLNSEKGMNRQTEIQKVPERMQRTESSPTKTEVVPDMFDIDQALEETSVPDLPSYPFTKFRDFSSFKKRQKQISPNRTLKSDGRSEVSTDESMEDGGSSQEDGGSSQEEGGSPPHSPPPKRPPGILKKSSHSSIQLPTRPDGNAQLIRHPGKGMKFASISAKVKAKQLARAASSLQKLEVSPPPQPETCLLSPTKLEEPTAEAESATNHRMPEESSGTAPLEELDSGDEQIYYMLVDDGSQLENQTILIDESQLSASGQHANVIIQGGVDGELLMQRGGELLLHQGGELLVQAEELLVHGGAAADFLRLGTRTVLLQDPSGQLVNVVVADEKDILNTVATVDTTGGVATLPCHPSSSLHAHVPLITTPSGQLPIMVASFQPNPM